ncbi:SPW repeat protein [Oceaniglobus roseus]|uniref:SPW repeat protein n=1 Tax=Oceaniglobus roseus TaxID=1737570 RepID=UPI0012FFF4C7|nr:SPW repeat protein [Kandeliimicrobium roseum]
MDTRHFQDWITLLAGLFLVVTPFLLSIPAQEGGSTWLLTVNFVASGIAAIVLALAALTAFRQWEEWLDIALGLWLVASPWILGFSDLKNAVWAAVGAGVVIAAMGAWTSFEEMGQHSA